MTLRSIQALVHLHLQATDGEIGTVEQFLFDDQKWTVRYLVVKVRNWVFRSKVLISPISIKEIQWDLNFISVSLTRKQVAESPDIDTDQPVSRQMEQRYSNYYSWPYYWTGTGIWGNGGSPTTLSGVYSGAFRPTLPTNFPEDQQQTPDEGDIHLRSSKEVIGYKVEASDAAFGHVEDLIIQDENWKIRYLVVDTKSYWPSKSVLVPPDWVDSISWSDRSCRINLPEKVIKQAPSFDPMQPIDRDFEKRLYGYYLRPGYWETEEGYIQKRSIG